VLSCSGPADTVRIVIRMTMDKATEVL
jgi:hypothetical protein